MGPRPQLTLDNTTLKLSEKLTKKEHQLGLLIRVKEDRALLGSNILSSVRPKIGRVFHHRDLDQKARLLLEQARVQILDECAIPEAQRDARKLQLGLTRALQRYDNQERIGKLIDEQKCKLDRSNRKRLDKKVKFYLDNIHQNSNKPPRPNTNRKRRRKRDLDRRRAERKRYRAAKNARKVEWMRNHVEQNVKGKLVINLSSTEVPDIAYMYLAKGMNFVESSVNQ